jgi:DNA topoisomerase-1
VPKKGSGLAGLSERNGPVRDKKMSIDSPSVNGTGKRKSRGSISYKDESDSDDEPIVSAISEFAI